MFKSSLGHSSIYKHKGDSTFAASRRKLRAGAALSEYNRVLQIIQTDSEIASQLPSGEPLESTVGDLLEIVPGKHLVRPEVLDFPIKCTRHFKSTLRCKKL